MHINKIQSFFLLISVCIICLITLIDLSIAVFLFSFYFLGAISCFFFSNRSKIQYEHLFSILTISSIVYFSYSILVSNDYSYESKFFVFPDQEYFFEISNILKNNNSLKDIFLDTIVNKYHIENEGFHFITGSLAYISNKYFSDNSILLQIISVAGFSVFINIFLYKTLLFYVKEQDAYKYTIIFSLCSIVFAYSPWLLRDIHILLFYTIGFYLIHKEFTVRNLIFLTLIEVIVIQFRLSSGIAFTFFPIFYFWFKGKDYKYKAIIYFVLILILLPVIMKIYYYLQASIIKTTGRLGRYEEFTSEYADAAGGFGSLIYKLPTGIKEFLVILFSQMQPFPPWSGIEYAKNINQVLMIVVFGISGVFWFYVFYISSSSILRNFSRIPNKILIPLLFFSAFLIFNTTNMNVRRIMAVYPILYTFFVFSQVHFNSSFLKKKRLEFLIIYVTLVFIYILLSLYKK